MSAINAVVGALAALLVLLLLDRLRQIRWPLSWIGYLLRRRARPGDRGEARPIYVAMYLLKVGWASWLVWEAFAGPIEWGQLMGVCGILCWVANTRCQWRDGPPEVVLSQRGGFDDRPHAHQTPAPRRRATDQPVEL